MSQQQNMLAIEGERLSGEAVRIQNITAAISVANNVKTSFGPIGLDKMLVDEIGDVTISNDGATILKMMEVEHPAAKVLVDLAGLQDQEVGDGTTTVVILAAELLQQAGELVKKKIHPTSIITGYRLACKEACRYITEHLAISVSDLGRESLVNAAKTSMYSKVIGTHMDFFANLVVDAMLAVKRTNLKGEILAPVTAVNILKCHGKSVKESILIDGYALNCTIASEMMPKMIQNAKIACIDMNLQKTRMSLGVHVLVSNPEELEKIRQRESDIAREKVELIIKSGANVVFTTKGIDDLCIKYLANANIMGVRRVTIEDMKRIAKATGAELVSTFANLDGDESFDSSMLGSAESVTQDRFGDNEMIVVSGTKSQKSASIVIRSANEFMCDEIERSIHDSLCVVKRVIESSSIVAGGGSVEAALSVYLDNFARSFESKSQLAVGTFSRSLQVIPKTLATNAAKDSIEFLAKLLAHHVASQNDTSKSDWRYHGLDLFQGKVVDCIKNGVVEPAMSKIKSLKFATEAAITILRIDESMRIANIQQPQGQNRH